MMSGTVIVVLVIAVFCLLVGPILMLKPSPRQRQLAAFRAQGIALGLKVSTEVLDGKPYTVYAAPWPEEHGFRFAAAPWTLMRKPYEHAIHVARVWDFSDQNRASDGERASITELLEGLPTSVMGVGVSPRGLAVYWLEKGSPEELDKLASMLKNAALELWPLVRKPDPAAPRSAAATPRQP